MRNSFTKLKLMISMKLGAIRVAVFTTNITQLTREGQVHNRRLEMPITDETAQIDFYLAYLKTNKSHFKVDITAIQTAWAHLK